MVGREAGIGLARAGGRGIWGFGVQLALGWVVVVVVAVWLCRGRTDGGNGEKELGDTPGLASCLPLLAARGRVVVVAWWGEMGREPQSRLPVTVIPSR